MNILDHILLTAMISQCFVNIPTRFFIFNAVSVNLQCGAHQKYNLYNLNKDYVEYGQCHSRARSNSRLNLDSFRN